MPLAWDVHRRAFLAEAGRLPQSPAAADGCGDQHDDENAEPAVVHAKGRDSRILSEPDEEGIAWKVLRDPTVEGTFCLIDNVLSEVFTA